MSMISLERNMWKEGIEGGRCRLAGVPAQRPLCLYRHHLSETTLAA